MADPKDSVDSSDSLSCAASSTSTSQQEPTSSVLENSKPDLVVEAVQSIQQGKRHLFVSDFYSAVTSFEHAVKILDSCYGTGAEECGEAYLLYGTAMFELSRLESGVMDGLVNVDANESSGEDDEEEEEDAKENDDDENEAEAKSIPEPEISSEEKIDIDLIQPSTSKGETSNSNGEKSDEEEDAGNEATSTEISFEVLGLARDIFSRSEATKENRLNLAEALQKLGEISIEWENNENALYMLNECLEIRKELLEPDDRLIALTYHFLGITFSFKCEYDNANSCFENALGVLQLRIKNLNEKIIDENLDKSEKETIEREISQLELLLPDLKSKIEDNKEQMLSQMTTLKSLEKESEQETKQIKIQVTQDKPINNISHLIKRKKEVSENDDVLENGSESMKKARTDVNSSIADAKETN